MNGESNHRENIRPEIPLETDAVGTLLGLARAFLPGFELPSLVGQSYAEPPGPTAEARFFKPEARYQVLLEQLPAVTFMAVFEEEGLSEIYVSPQIETLLGYTVREWAEQPILWYERLHLEDRDRWNVEFSRTVAWTEPFKGDYRFHAKDGHVVWIHGEAKIVRDRLGRPSFIQGIGYDITTMKGIQEELRRARDDAEQANQAKSQFLSRTSHELRTPLNAVMGFAQLLEMNAQLDDDDKESVDEILKAGRHLLELINEVLDISAIDSGQMTLAVVPVSINLLMDEALSLIAPLAHGRAVLLQSTIPTGENCQVLADARRLKQVFLNLLSNAVKYNRPGGTAIVECGRRETPPRPSYRISVSDTGSGLSAEKLGRLFTPFDRLGAEQSGVEGTGLGLAYSKSMVTAMGGTLGVESIVGLGSTFWIDLPLPEYPLGRGDETAGAQSGIADFTD
jgi:PAS domain S-box-containing protein